MKKLGIFGGGFLGGIIARAWHDGLLPEYELVGICGRNVEKTSRLAEEVGCPAYFELDELLAQKPDIVSEAASVGGMKENAEKILLAGADLTVLSIGAFADKEFYAKIRDTAAKCGRKVYIASGAVGGFDVLRTVCLMDKASANIDGFKAPERFIRSSLFRPELLNGTRQQAFSGTTKEAIEILPTQVNVAVAAALASTGPENMTMHIDAVPGFIGDEHRITAENSEVKAVVDIYCKTSAISGWSVVALLQNLVSPIVF